MAGAGAKGFTAHGGPLQCGLARPHGAFVDADSARYIGDSENHRLRVVRR